MSDIDEGEMEKRVKAYRSSFVDDTSSGGFRSLFPCKKRKREIPREDPSELRKRIKIVRIDGKDSEGG